MRIGKKALLPEGSARTNTIRVFEDGNYVFSHTDYDFFGPKVGIDIFRFENGLIVEHWELSRDLIEYFVKPDPLAFDLAASDS